MKSVVLFFVLAVAGLAETPDEWFDAYSAHSEHSARRMIAYVEKALPGDTTYRRLSERGLADGKPLLRYLLKYYLAHDPAKLTWEDGFGPFLQVLPCNCGQEGSIDTNEFRRFFPAYSKASSAWEELDWKQKQTYDALRVSRPRDEEERKVDDAEMADLKARFLRLKEANQSSQPTRGKAPRG